MRTGQRRRTRGTARRDDARTERERTDDLRRFADAVVYAARRAPESYRFCRYKIFIAALHPNQHTRRLLVEAHRAGFLRLARADLTPAMSKRMVKDSEVGYMNAVWHLIDLSEGAR
jgi:hypothetical protein